MVPSHGHTFVVEIVARMSGYRCRKNNAWMISGVHGKEEAELPSDVRLEYRVIAIVRKNSTCELGDDRGSSSHGAGSEQFASRYRQQGSFLTFAGY